MTTTGSFPIPAPFTSSEALTDTRLRFFAGSLPPAEWNYATQLAVILGVVRSRSADDAARLLRTRWRAWATVHGGAAAASHDYHDTMIGFMLHIVQLHAAEYPQPADALTDVDELIARWGDPELVLTYYSLSRLFSDEARERFLAPDLRPLPSPFGG
jgi:hypothetical protein